MAWIYLIEFPKNEVIHNTSISSLWKWIIFNTCNWVGMSIILLTAKQNILQSTIMNLSKPQARGSKINMFFISKFILFLVQSPVIWTRPSSSNVGLQSVVNIHGLESFNQCWILHVLNSQLTDTSNYLKRFKQEHQSTQYLSLQTCPQKWKMELVLEMKLWPQDDSILWALTDTTAKKDIGFSTKYLDFFCKFRP